MIIAKSIKPSRFKVEAIYRELEKEAEAVSKEIEADFKKTVRTWNRKVKFIRLVQVGNDQVAVLVGTDDEIYRYVDEGTRAHWIYPKRKKALKFTSDYKAKTTPQIIDSQAGGAFGDMVFSKSVRHPGTKARQFDKEIQKKWKKKFKRHMEDALKRGVKASGHAIR